MTILRAQLHHIVKCSIFDLNAVERGIHLCSLRNHPEVLASAVPAPHYMELKAPSQEMNRIDWNWAAPGHTDVTEW